MDQDKTNQEIKKKDVAKAYEKYSKQFTPKPTYFANGLRAFIVGGLITTAGFYVNNLCDHWNHSFGTAFNRIWHI